MATNFQKILCSLIDFQFPVCEKTEAKVLFPSSPLRRFSRTSKLISTSDKENSDFYHFVKISSKEENSRDHFTRRMFPMRIIFLFILNKESFIISKCIFNLRPWWKFPFAIRWWNFLKFNLNCYRGTHHFLKKLRRIRNNITSFLNQDSCRTIFLTCS